MQRILIILLLVSGCLGRDIARVEDHLSGSTSETGTAASSGWTGEPSLFTASGPGGSSGTGTAADSATSGPATSEDDTATPATASTGAPAVCGDGVIEGEEECDDPEDAAEVACTTTCARPRLAFLTSERFTGDINGLEGGDTRCRGAAAKADIPNPGNFKAILSDSTTSAADRLHHSRGPYRLINGLQVARDWEALMHETLENPLDTTELGTKGYPGAWTGTAPGGEAVEGIDHCEDWHSESIVTPPLGSWGYSTEVDGQWLAVTNELFNPDMCTAQLALYCLEQE